MPAVGSQPHTYTLFLASLQLQHTCTYELRTLHVTDLVIKFLFETFEFVSETSDE